ncbi:hypothetical protein SNE40_011895 [Patella caerulea]|uniref:C17orf113 probable zinc finger domain-containing protein n=1 Tax=Patella caerulea TaxID=87958 RepID=A0AAN8JKN9_PATCE
MGRKRKIEQPSSTSDRRVSDFFNILPPKCPKTTDDTDMISSRPSDDITALDVELIPQKTTAEKNFEKRKILSAFGKSRSFRDEWKFSNPWLRYDAATKTMFCSTCELAKVTNSFTTGCSVLKKECITAHFSNKVKYVCVF